MTTNRTPEQIAAEIREKLEPRLEHDEFRGGYNCCGCSTYRQIIEDAVAVVLGTYEPPKLDEEGYVVD